MPIADFNYKKWVTYQVANRLKKMYGLFKRVALISFLSTTLLLLLVVYLMFKKQARDEQHWKEVKEQILKIKSSPVITAQEGAVDSLLIEKITRSNNEDQTNTLIRHIKSGKKNVVRATAVLRWALIAYLVILCIVVVLFFMQRKISGLSVLAIGSFLITAYTIYKTSYEIDIEELNISWNNQIDTDSIYSFVDSSKVFAEGKAWMSQEQKDHLRSVALRMRDKYFISLTVYGGVDKRSLKNESYLLYRDNQTLAQIRADSIKKELGLLLDKDSSITKPFIQSSIRGASSLGTDSSAMASNRKVLITGNYFNKRKRESNNSSTLFVIGVGLLAFLLGLLIGNGIRKDRTVKLRKIFVDGKWINEDDIHTK